jgi:hypothetical protein
MSRSASRAKALSSQSCLSNFLCPSLVSHSVARVRVRAEGVTNLASSRKEKYWMDPSASSRWGHPGQGSSENVCSRVPSIATGKRPRMRKGSRARDRTSLRNRSA